MAKLLVARTSSFSSLVFLQPFDPSDSASQPPLPTVSAALPSSAAPELFSCFLSCHAAGCLATLLCCCCHCLFCHHLHCLRSFLLHVREQRSAGGELCAGPNRTIGEAAQESVSQPLNKSAWAVHVYSQRRGIWINTASSPL